MNKNVNEEATATATNTLEKWAALNALSLKSYGVPLWKIAGTKHEQTLIRLAELRNR